MQCSFFIIYAVFALFIILELYMNWVFMNMMSMMGGFVFLHPIGFLLILMVVIILPMWAFVTYFTLHTMWFANAVKHGCVFCGTFTCCLPFFCVSTSQIWIGVLGVLAFLQAGNLLSDLVTFAEAGSISTPSELDFNAFVLFDPMVWACVTAFLVVLQLYFATYVCRFYGDVRNGNAKKGAKVLVGEALLVTTLDNLFEEATESDSESGLIG